MVFYVQWQVELCNHFVSTALWTSSHITTLAVCLMSNIPLSCSEATRVPSGLWSFLAVVLQETALWARTLRRETTLAHWRANYLTYLFSKTLGFLSMVHTERWSLGLVIDQPNRILGLYPGQSFSILSRKELAFRSRILTDDILSSLHSTPWRSYPKTF